MEVHAHMLDRSRMLAAGTHLPFQKLALCLDCEACFDLGYATCPACSSRTWSPLARFFNLGSGSGARALEGCSADNRQRP